MPKRSCALIGQGQGPLVRTGRDGHVRVLGMKEGEVALLLIFRGGESRKSQPLEENGEHHFAFCDFVCVAYEGASKNFTAVVETEDAVRSA